MRYIYKKKPKMAVVYKKIVNLSKGYIIFDYIKHKVKFKKKGGNL